MTSDREAARAYWQDATDTFVAGGEYYTAAAAALRARVLPLLDRSHAVLDIGCGEGTYTALIAPAVDRVDAYDLSPGLVAAAVARGLANATFTVGDATDTAPGSYDVVLCMGVLVCVVDDAEFGRALTAAAASVRPGGLLVLRETLSGWGRRIRHDGDYVACYRARSAYLDPLRDLGFTLAVDERLAVWSRAGRRSNHLWVLRRGPATS